MKPIVKRRVGAFSASAFRHTITKKDDSTFETMSVAFQRSYKKDDEWVNNSISIKHKQLDDAIRCLEDIKNAINLLEA